MDSIDDVVKALDVKVKLLEHDILNVLDRVKNTHETETNQQKTNRVLISIISAFALFVGGGSFLSFNSRIEDIKSSVEDRIARMEGSSLIDSAYIQSVGAKSGYIVVSPSISRSIVNNNIVIYTLSMSFDADITSKGSIPGLILGIYRKYDGDYTDFITSRIHNSLITHSLMSNGDATYYDSPLHVVEGYPTHVSWFENVSGPNCEQLDNLLSEMRKDKILGFVHVSPIVAQIKQKPELVSFAIQLGPYDGTHTCKDFASIPP